MIISYNTPYPHSYISMVYVKTQSIRSQCDRYHKDDNFLFLAHPYHLFTWFLHQYDL